MNVEASLKGKTIFAPEMDYVTSRTIAAAFNGILGIETNILPTGEKSSLMLGNRFTSGKECHPYIQTTSDILTFLFERREKGLGTQDIVLFMPSACGPCRFGQYIPALELVLKQSGFKDMAIISPSAADSYTFGGLISKETAQKLRRAAWNALVFGDILNRMWWRSRPYEREKGQADRLMEESLESLCETIREESPANASIFSSYRQMLNELRRIGQEFTGVIDTKIPRKPQVAIIGEIYMRFHAAGNQNLVRELERNGCETVTASMAEWVNYVTHLNAYRAKEAISRRLRVGSLREKLSLEAFKQWRDNALTGWYQTATMRKAYRTVKPVIDIHPDHSTAQVLKHLGNDYHVDLAGEAILSIAMAKAFESMGFDGVANCMPFGCMPSNNADEVLKPQFQERRFPYVALPYDQTVQPSTRQQIGVFADKARRLMEAKTGIRIR